MALLTEGAAAPRRSTNMALLTEGTAARSWIYKHGPPDGGRTYLTPWMYKDETPDDGGRASHPGSTKMKPLTGFSTRYRSLSILLLVRQLDVSFENCGQDRLSITFHPSASCQLV